MKIIAALLAIICTMSLTATEKRDELLPLENKEAFPQEQQEARSAVIAALVHEGINPREYFAEVESRDAGKILEFHLWHPSALKQRGSTRGDPTGRCRTVVYDSTANKVIRIYRWR